MLDKRNLEQILSDQQEELDIRRGETLCHRPEEALIDLSSTQAQVVIGVRRSGNSMLPGIGEGWCEICLCRL